MITHLRGKLTDAQPTQVVVEVGGVGYEVLIPVSSFEKLPALNAEVTLLTHLAVREDAHVLYGFMSAGERALFRQLINLVSGIGPKIALNILSGVSVDSLRSAVQTADVKFLSRIPGVGKKTAERMVVELKDRLGATQAGAVPAMAAGSGDRALADTAQALEALGLKPNDALDAARAARAMLGADAPVEQLVRAALRRNG